MRAFALVVLLLVLAGCTAREGAAFMPRLVVRGALVHRVSETRARRDWRIDAVLDWRPGRMARTPSEPTEEAARAEHRSFRCAHPALCAWEQRARWRAQTELLRRIEEGDEP